MKALNNLVLVLNKSWLSVRIETVMLSIKRIFCGNASIVDEDTFEVFDWDKWLEKFSRRRDEEWPFKYGYISSARLNIRLPSVIVLSHYNKVPRVTLRLTKRNLLIRDRFRCQYTGRKIRATDATVDHIVPKSQGGKHIWENVVISSREANIKKGNRTPEQAGMLLLKQPAKPSWDPFYTIIAHYKIPASWSKFLNQDISDMVDAGDGIATS